MNKNNYPDYIIKTVNESIKRRNEEITIDRLSKKQILFYFASENWIWVSNEYKIKVIEDIYQVNLHNIINSKEIRGLDPYITTNNKLLLVVESEDGFHKFYNENFELVKFKNLDKNQIINEFFVPYNNIFYDEDKNLYYIYDVDKYNPMYNYILDLNNLTYETTDTNWEEQIDDNTKRTYYQNGKYEDCIYQGDNLIKYIEYDKYGNVIFWKKYGYNKEGKRTDFEDSNWNSYYTDDDGKRVYCQYY